MKAHLGETQKTQKHTGIHIAGVFYWGKSLILKQKPAELRHTRCHFLDIKRFHDGGNKEISNSNFMANKRGSKHLSVDFLIINIE